MRVAPDDTADVVVVRGFASDGTRVGPSDLLVSLRGREARRAYASLRKEVTGTATRWVRLAGSGDGERGGGDARRDSVAVRRDLTRSRPPNRTRLNRPPTDPETNRRGRTRASRRLRTRSRAARVRGGAPNVPERRERRERRRAVRRAGEERPAAFAANCEKTSEDVRRRRRRRDDFARAALASLLARPPRARAHHYRARARTHPRARPARARDWWTRVADRGDATVSKTPRAERRAPRLRRR